MPPLRVRDEPGGGVRARLARVTALRFGAHVDQDNPLAHAAASGFDVVQFFLGDPQGWKGPRIDYPDGAEALASDAAAAGVDLYVHAPYVLNVATTNNRIRIPSRKLLQQQLHACASIGARGLVVHGGHVLAGDDPSVGFDNWRKCIDGLDLAVPLLIENTAGGDHAMSRHLEALDRLWTALADADGFERVGFCLDTCHAHAAGLDLDGLVDRVRGITGRIDLVHLNDSRDAAGSGADRHDVLGAGHIDSDLLVQVVLDADAPVILETPTSVPHAGQLAWLAERLAG